MKCVNAPTAAVQRKMIITHFKLLYFAILCLLIIGGVCVHSGVAFNDSLAARVIIAWGVNEKVRKVVVYRKGFYSDKTAFASFRHVYVWVFGVKTILSLLKGRWELLFI